VTRNRRTVRDEATGVSTPTILPLLTKKEEYEIDLERVSSCAEMLDWIFQIAGKTWGTPMNLGHLVRALDDIFHPQETLCSGGAAKQFDVHKHLATAFSQK